VSGRRESLKFYLGTHMPNWLEQTNVPLFVSRRRLADRKTLPRPKGWWCLDSGGFTELNLYGYWRTTEAQYIADVRRFVREMGRLEWVAPMDWMCEPFVLAKTGMTVQQHQRRTIENFLRLRQALGPLVIPVLQGWTLDDYLRCWERYHEAGVDLEWERVVGVGSVCRRQNTVEVALIFRMLSENLLGRQLHGFGVKINGLESYADCLSSADSMAWSYQARNAPPLPGCIHKSCANCLRYALRWRTQLLERLGQQRLEVVA
jgi:hypothetical protein